MSWVAPVRSLSVINVYRERGHVRWSDSIQVWARIAASVRSSDFPHTYDSTTCLTPYPLDEGIGDTFVSVVALLLLLALGPATESYGSGFNGAIWRFRVGTKADDLACG